MIEILTDFLNENNKYYTASVNRNIRYLPEKLVFEKSDANCVNEVFPVTKKYNNTKLVSAKLTPIQASLKKIEKNVHKKFFG